MAGKKHDVTVVRGDTVHLPVKWVDSANTAIPFTNRALRFTVREYEHSANTLFDKNSSDNPNDIKRMELSNVANIGVVEILISSAESASFPLGDLPYNLQVTDQDGFVRTLLRGRIQIIEDIAR
jgi:hypothetical protein